MTMSEETRELHEEHVALRRGQLVRGITYYQKQFGYSPTVRELQEVVQVNSTSTVLEDLRWLRSHGMITWTPKTARTLRVLKEEEEA